MHYGTLEATGFEDGNGELIFYQRADSTGPKESFYVRAPSPDPTSLRQALSLAYGQVGRVKKQRTLYLPPQSEPAAVMLPLAK
jgi:hypothetical protein